jgi:agmatine/peptidylarginine deiminase
MRLVAQWEKQKSVLFVFPFAKSAWRINLLQAQDAYMSMINHISKTQECIVFINDDTIKKYHLNQNIKLVEVKTDDTWIRDFGVISLKNNNNNNILKEFSFNGWGDKFKHYLDNQFNKKYIKEDIESIDFVCEGGAIDTNGLGVVLTTANSILNRNRNITTKQDVRKLFREKLGIKKMIILNNCYLLGDDTDFHIDMFCRFVDENTIMYISTEDRSNFHFYLLKELEQSLKKLKNLNNQKFNLIKLPLPKQIIKNGEYLPATYANFLITNDLVLVPIYNDKSDKLALDIIKSFFTNKKIVGIDSTPLIEHGGAIHCATNLIYD